MSSPQPHGIQVRGLFKLYGDRAEHYVKAVREGLTKAELNTRHGHILALNDINIDMPAGDIQVIMGLSGSGKSTFIRHINRLVTPTAGEVIVNGVDVVKMSGPELRAFRREQTAMVFQSFALLPHRTVLDNTLYGLEIRGVPSARRIEIGMRWIERVGLKGYESRYPSQLSGGMKQRVGLARALTNDAPVLLMDEAFSALDPLIRMEMQTVLLDLQKELRKTIVFITHDLDEALRLGNRVAILRDGKVIQQGTSEDIVLRPADEYVADFVKGVNRGRIVKVRTVMDPPSGEPRPKGPTIDADASVEDAISVMVGNRAMVTEVVDGSGRPIGTVSLHQLAAATVPSDTAQPYREKNGNAHRTETREESADHPSSARSPL